MKRRRNGKGSGKRRPPKGQTRTNGRDAATGRFAAGNTARLIHGLRSRRSVESRLLPAQLASFTEEHRQLLEDLGGEAQLTVTLRGLAKRHGELSVIADTIVTNLLQHGVLSTKGRQRAALSAYLNVVDRLNKLAAQLGLERKAKPAPSIEDFLKEKA